MINDKILITFIITSLTIILPPGPNTIYIASRSLNGGIKKGIISALGIDTGGLIYFLLAGFGISRLILHSTTVFLIIKYLGSAFLIYIGISIFLSQKNLNKNPDKEIQKNSFVKDKNIYFQGIVTCLLNPKVGVFFFAYLPQFGPLGAENYSTYIFTFGLIFAVLGSTWDITIAVLSGLLSKPFIKNNKSRKYLNYISGSVLILLGLISVVMSIFNVKMV